MNGSQNIFFETKDESNKRRDQEALSRASHDRFMFFLKLCHEMQFFSQSKPHPNRKKNNFVVE